MDGIRGRGFTQATIPAGYAKYLLRQLFEPWAKDMIERGTPYVPFRGYLRHGHENVAPGRVIYG